MHLFSKKPANVQESYGPSGVFICWYIIPSDWAQLSESNEQINACQMHSLECVFKMRSTIIFMKYMGLCIISSFHFYYYTYCEYFCISSCYHYHIGNMIPYPLFGLCVIMLLWLEICIVNNKGCNSISNVNIYILWNKSDKSLTINHISLRLFYLSAMWIHSNGMDTYIHKMQHISSQWLQLKNLSSISV